MREAKIVECDGAAHGNPYIDHCMVCLPYWGKYPACPDCGRKLAASRALADNDKAKRGRCTNSACASHRRWFRIAGDV
jgi:hypothetical protein